MCNRFFSELLALIWMIANLDEPKPIAFIIN